MLPGKPEYQRPPSRAQARIGLGQIGFTRAGRQMKLAPLAAFGHVWDQGSCPHHNRLVAILHAGHVHRL